MPSPDPEEGVQILEELATLMGFSIRFDLFPDRCRPDVCGFAPGTKGIFIGEAKATETPGCLATHARFLNYLTWIRTSRAALTQSVCAICFANPSHAAAWKTFLAATLQATHYGIIAIHTCRLDARAGVAWATFAKACPNNAHAPERNLGPRIIQPAAPVVR